MVATKVVCLVMSLVVLMDLPKAEKWDQNSAVKLDVHLAAS